METCNVLIVGGGPAGSSCAWRLTRAGFDVVVMDRAIFPRDKVCAGWITPQAVADLELDVDEYRVGRTFQDITAFRVGLSQRRRAIDTHYDCPVSYGIRRCEFDHYLLQRSRARLRLGEGAVRIRRDVSSGRWIVNDQIEAPMLVGSGGHFCPVARMLEPRVDGSALVVAQEAEFEIDDDDGWVTPAQTPELYFAADLKGYGWIFRKGRYVNIGIGRTDRRSLPKATRAFVGFLRVEKRIPDRAALSWRGHAYLLSTSSRRSVDDGVLLAGDAAGLAYPASGEGIRPAIESGLLAASAIVAAQGDFSRARLANYVTQLHLRFGVAASASAPSPWRSAVTATIAPWLFKVPWFVRRQVLNRWFLRAHDSNLILQPPLSAPR
ncbi:MAG TPA: NAD(P)/FAD-dependent oxidoreductase [Vicinamibacterales bacterium]|nr:NAD(P)/FAD-dependent oxidoreductase [Vicinamibacterales bacterium]